MEQTPMGNTGYGELVRRSNPPQPEPEAVENQLDSLLSQYQTRKTQTAQSTEAGQTDRIQQLREQTINEFIPIFVELAEKYASSGIVMEMDASSLIQGGREIKFQFALGECRTELLGTATTEAIAFHETRYSPDLPGELMSGPMLRLRNLTADDFRAFVCERLGLLIRMAMKR